MEAEIESALDENAEYTDVDRAAKDGDQVNIDFDGSIDGEAWDSDTDYDLVIGSEDFQPEFERTSDRCKSRRYTGIYDHALG